MFKTKFDRTETKGVKFEIPSMVQQSDKDSTDINLIIKRYCECGICPTCTVKPPISEDVAMLSGEDFNSMMQKIAQVNNQFYELPAEVRKKFANNPSNMLEFIQDPNNREEAEKLGLVEKRYNQSSFGFNGDNSVSSSLDMVGSVSGETDNQTIQKEVNNPANVE